MRGERIVRVLNKEFHCHVGNKIVPFKVPISKQVETRVVGVRRDEESRASYIDVRSDNSTGRSYIDQRVALDAER